MKPGTKGTIFPWIAALLFLACGPEKVSHQWFAMDTEFHVSLPGAGTEDNRAKVPPESAFTALERESRRLELVFSDYLPFSALAGLAGRTGDTLPIPAPELAEVLRAAERAAFETGGLFDATLHDLKQAWGLSSGDTGRIPDDSAIARALRGNPVYGSGPGDHPALFPPYKVLDGSRLVLLRDSVPFDLGGIAKGYAVDRLDALLDSLGYRTRLVQAGGDMRVGGLRPGGPWRIGIRHPRMTDSLAGLIRVDPGKAVSTSGDYERYFDQAGVRYHHIFDPRTGRPAGPWCAVTVVAPTSLWADALSEPLFVSGPAEGQALLSRMGAEALWLKPVGDGLCHAASPGMAGRFELPGIPACGDVAGGGAP
jgi:thiamine biosynthesis lipoprotein